jgi:hypothetical protein
MIQCVKCLDDIKHPMGQIIDNSGLCSGCITHSEKDSIDWSKKFTELTKKCQDILKKNKHRKYDCIIPLNADAEDYYIVEQAIKLGLKPLLLYVNNYFGSDLSWRNLHNLESVFDLDLVTFNPNMFDYKEAVRTSLRKFNSIYWPYQAIKTAYPVRLALEMKIPIILWGGLQAIEQTGKFSHYDKVEMSGWSRVQHDLFCVDELSFFGSGAQINEKNQFHYMYPPLKDARKITGIYLSNYIRWDPWNQNHKMLKYGFSPDSAKYTFDQFERAGSSVFYKMHDLLRYKKHGYKKVRDHLSREIRHNRITKHDANKLYSLYKFRKIDIAPFFDWLGSSPSGMKLFIDKRLSDFSHIIGVEDSDIFPEKIIKDGYLVDSHEIHNEFLIYHKGI